MKYTDGICGDDICNEQEVRSAGEALVSSGLADLGFNYVNLDDCWCCLVAQLCRLLVWLCSLISSFFHNRADHRDDNGNIVADATRFPSGMKATADYLHSLGLKFGKYC